MRVVIADDDSTQRSYLSAIVARAGHEPIATADAPSAIAALIESQSSLLISDIEMPGPDGLDLVRQVRSQKLGRYVYIILVTARDQQADLVAGLAAGADDFMTKPINASVMSVRLRGAQRVLEYDRDLTQKSVRLAQAMSRLEEDLEAAASAQRWLLPANDVVLNGCRVRAMFTPSRFVSGDVFDYFELDDHRIGFYAADVAGHGVRAALLAGAIGHLIHARSFAAMAIDGDEACPRRLVEEMNTRFSERIAPEEFFTMTAGIIDERDDLLTLCQAGHPRPLLLPGMGGERWLGTSSNPVGVVDQPYFEDVVVPFRPGDRLIVYSDGVAEAEGRSMEPFGEQRLADLFEHFRDAPPDDLIAAVAAELVRWTGLHSPADDVSAIIFDRQERPHDCN
jgi:phosphoserine phosphatase RsbU/P